MKNISVLLVFLSCMNVIQGMETEQAAALVVPGTEKVITFILSDGSIAVPKSVLDQLQINSSIVKEMFEDVQDIQEIDQFALPVMKINDFQLLQEYLPFVENKAALTQKLETIKIEKLVQLLNIADYLNIDSLVNESANQIALILTRFGTIKNMVQRLGRDKIFAVLNPSTNNLIAQKIIEQAPSIAQNIERFMENKKIIDNRTSMFAYNPKEKNMLLCRPEGGSFLHDETGKKEICRLDPDARKIAVAEFTPDGTRVATGGMLGNILLWNTQSCQLDTMVQGLIKSPIKSISFDSAVNKIVFNYVDALILFDLISNKIIKAFTAQEVGSIINVFLTTDAKYCVYITSNGLALYDVEKKENFTIKIESASDFFGRKDFRSMVYYPPTQQILFGMNNGDMYVWQNFPNGAIEKFIGQKQLLSKEIIDKGVKAITTLAINSSGTLCASGSVDGMVRVWDMKTRTMLTELPKEKSEIKKVAFGPDDSFIGYVTNHNILYEWNVKKFKSLRNYLQKNLTLYQALMLKEITQFRSEKFDITQDEEVFNAFSTLDEVVKKIITENFAIKINNYPSSEKKLQKKLEADDWLD